MTILLAKGVSQKVKENCITSLHACIYIAGMISNENAVLSKGEYEDI